MARRPRAARPLLGGRGPAALVARALVSASLGLGRRGRRRTGGSSSRAPPPSTLLGGCPGLLQGPGGGPAGLQTSDGSAPVSRHTGALAPRTHRRQRDHGGTEDGRVLVCPPCNGPVPVRRGESPDVAVGAHVDGDCRRPPGQETAKESHCFSEGGELAWFLGIPAHVHFFPELPGGSAARSDGAQTPALVCPSGVGVGPPAFPAAAGPGTLAPAALLALVGARERLVPVWQPHAG
ncbi:PREDICTED: AN1-type zinc finger protein 2A isoform X1 [Capra hircus]|uniref:AN1-type zinc finger protein 2A isoform X1 n=1 Tax=Capra hircus TaxID=9925 RepID=UPI00084767F7|nr:PREDICTED: AN1-type zinc finger protein 2A isoform X1 [Capra hircus]